MDSPVNSSPGTPPGPATEAQTPNHLFVCSKGISRVSLGTKIAEMISHDSALGKYGLGNITTLSPRREWIGNHRFQHMRCNNNPPSPLNGFMNNPPPNQRHSSP